MVIGSQRPDTSKVSKMNKTKRVYENQFGDHMSITKLKTNVRVSIGVDGCGFSFVISKEKLISFIQ